MESKFYQIRKDYGKLTLDREHLHPWPVEQFKNWLQEAISSEQTEPTAMSLASVDVTGQPSQRIVLMKGVTDKGICFYTNYQSRKGAHFLFHPKASALFFWPKMERQVRIEGVVQKLSEQQSDEYFSSRPRDSQIGAWASPQSEFITNRKALEDRFETFKAKFEGQPVPRPPHWGGYILIPHRFEFWQGRPNRLHDRFEYYLTPNGWTIRRLAP